MNSPSGCRLGPDIATLLLGELNTGDARRIKDHLDQCPDCAEQFESLRRVVDRLRQLPLENGSPDLTDRILSRLPTTDWVTANGSGRPAVVYPRLAKLAAVLLAALGLGTVLWPSWNRSPRSDAPSGRVTVADRTPAVNRALTWLQNNQEPDGRWAFDRWGGQKNYATGVSALALMAFMDGDPDALRGAHAETVRRGIDHLLRHQNEQGLFGPEFPGAIYNQALATLAMLKANALENNPAWRSSSRRALDLLCSAQTGSGGWGYWRSGSAEPNTSATIWPVQALLQAEALGYSGLREPVERGLAWLKTNVNPDGWVGYRRADDFPYGQDTLTAAGAVCFLMEKSGPNLTAAPAMLPALHRLRMASDQPVDFYRSYFLSRAMDLSHDRAATDLLTALRKQLLDLQNTSGQEAGSWDASDRWGRVGGRVYSTALAALTLKSK